MGRRIDQFCEDLRVKLTDIDNNFGALDAKINQNADLAERDVRDVLAKVHARVEHDKAKVAAAQAEIKNWADQQKSATNEKVAEWKAKRETNMLQNRAAMAERFAAAAADYAVGAVGIAEEAALQAWLARRDVGDVKPKA